MHHRSLRLALAITTGLCSTVLLSTPAIAQSLPTGPSVGFQSGGTAIVYGTSGTTGTLNLGDNQRSIVNWSSFGVGTGSAMQFQYGGAGQGAVLNRVVGATSSSIAGSITGPSNLDIFLINPNGIIVGAGANINVGGLVASTLDLTDADFANGSAYNFSGTGTTGVTVNGGATLNSAGSLVLLGGFVSTSGALSAGRDVVVAAASDISLATAPGSPLSMTVNQGTPLSAGVTLAGTVNGANIYAATASRAGVANNILNVSGALTAATATATDRGIVLAAGTSDSGVTVASGGGNDTSGSARLAVGGTATAVAGASAPASSAGIRAGALGLVSGAGSLDAAGAVTVYSATNSVSLTGVNAITARGDVNAVASNGSINIRKATTSSGDVDFQALGIQLTNATIGSSNGLVELLTGDVAVSGNNVLGSGAGGVTVWGAVNGVGSLTINSPGLTRLVGNVGQATALTSLTTDAAGATELAGTVRTTGAQTYNDAVYVSGSNLLQSTAAGNITFGGTIDGGSALTINTAGATSFNGTIGGTTSLTSVTTDAAGTTSIGAGSIRTTGAQAFGDNVVLASNAVLTGATFSAASVSGSGNDLALNFSGPTAINGATMLGIRNLSSGGGGTTLLSGTVQTTGLQSYSDAISLSGNTVLASSGGGAVAFNGTVDGAYGLTVNTSGATSFNGNVGASTALTSLTTNTGGSTTIAGGSIRTAGAQSYGDSVILSNGTHTLNASSVAFGGPVNAASYGVPTLSIMTSGATSFANTIFGLGALGVSASTVSFTGTNNRVGTLAANVTAGGFSFGTDDSLTIGAVNGLSGITTAAGQNIRIETPSSTSTRTLTVAGPVKASGGGDVTILYWGGSLQGTGLISGDHLLVATNEGVGTRAMPIKTAVNSMSVFGGNQGAFINETDSVTLLDSTIPACNGTCTGTINNGGASYDLTAGGTITVGGFTWAGGDISLTTSSGDISFTPAGQVNTSGDIRLTAADNLNGGGGPLAARNIYLAADDWTNGIFGAATLQESQDLSITDTASGLTVSALTGVSAARNLSISTIGADLTVGGISAGGNINLSSSGDLALTDTIAAVGDTLSLSAGRSISQTGTNGLQAGTLTGTSGDRPTSDCMPTKLRTCRRSRLMNLSCSIPEV